MSFRKIGVIGQGYVGLPLSLQLVRSGVSVLGFDLDTAKIQALNSGESYIRHIPGVLVENARSTGRFEATSDFARLEETDAVLICVPTPLNKNREPDITCILDAGRAIARHLRPGMLIVLESTTYPGTTDGELRAVLEAESGLKAGEDFSLAFSPEREDPSNPESRIGHIPKVVGGFTRNCGDRAAALYALAVDKVVRVDSCKTAEAAKLLENIFRSVNIALVNELKVVYAAMGIDVWDVIAAARTKPFGFMPFYPGPGLGGHCIPVDPFYLTWKAREFGLHTRFIELAGEINTAMPEYVLKRIIEALNSRRRSVSGSRILLLGLAYKANVDDDRQSPTYPLIGLLSSLGAEVTYYDPFIPRTRSGEHADVPTMLSVPWEESVFRQMDAVVIMTAHRGLDYTTLAHWCSLIIDTRNAMEGIAVPPGLVWKA